MGDTYHTAHHHQPPSQQPSLVASWWSVVSRLEVVVVVVLAFEELEGEMLLERRAGAGALVEALKTSLGGDDEWTSYRCSGS